MFTLFRVYDMNLIRWKGPDILFVEVVDILDILKGDSVVTNLVSLGDVSETLFGGCTEIDDHIWFPYEGRMGIQPGTDGILDIVDDSVEHHILPKHMECG
jgi:hypothetical protein